MVPAAEVYQRIQSQWPLVKIPNEASETARKYRFADLAKLLCIDSHAVPSRNLH